MLQWTQNTGLYDVPLLFTYHQERKKAIHDDTMLITEDLLVLSLSYVSLLCFYAFVYVQFIFPRPNLRIWEIRVCMCAQLCLPLCNPMDCTPPGSSVHGIFQARKLEWVAISFSRGSFWPRAFTRVSCIGITTEPPGKPSVSNSSRQNQ